MANTESNYRPLVGGSGITTMEWYDGSGPSKLIAFCQSVTVNWPQAVAEEVAVQPLNARRPIEIVTANAVRGGTIDLELMTLCNQEIWQQFSILANSQDLADILQAVSSVSGVGQSGLIVNRTYRPQFNPSIFKGQSPNNTYVESFYGCVVTRIEDSIPISVETMLVNKKMTLAFTKSLKSWIGTGTPQSPDFTA